MNNGTQHLDRAFPIVFFLMSVVCLKPSFAIDSDITHQLDNTRSDIRVLVYKEGALQFMGHNHVIRVSQFEGVIKGNMPDITKSTLEVKIPVMNLVVDNLEDRKRSGMAFSDEIDHESSLATRNNLLSDAVLNAEKYPWIMIHGRVKTMENKLYLELVIQIKETEKTYLIPVDLVIHERYIVAKGIFAIKQTDIGIKPFSVLGGLLAVQDELTITFDIVAMRM